MLHLNFIKKGNIRGKKVYTWEIFFNQYLGVYIKTMKKAGKYARPIGFGTKNSPWLCNVYIFLFISKSIHFT